MTERNIENRGIIFVVPVLAGEGLLAARAVRKLAGVKLYVICEQSQGVDTRDAVDELFPVESVYQVDKLVQAMEIIINKHGVQQKVVTVHETLLLPVAQARERMGIAGMSPETVGRVLNKSQLKQTLRQAGISIARDRLIDGTDEARRFVREVGYPFILKPLNGSGGLATWRIPDDAHLDLALELIQPGIDNPVLAEEYINGRELCIDTVTLQDEPLFYSICCYEPPILEALDNPSTQWRCVMPRSITDGCYQKFIEQGLSAVRAMSAGDSVTHLEGFISGDGKVYFTDATLRPAGARIGPMLAHAYDIDPHYMWARLMVDGSFDGPWERNYAVGTVFLRGIGKGNIEKVSGVDTLQEKFATLIVDSRLPQAGAAKSSTYTGDGYITVRHPETRVVYETLDAIAGTVSITYSGVQDVQKGPHTENNLRTSLGKEWKQRLNYFDQQLYKPVWDEFIPQSANPRHSTDKT